MRAFRGVARNILEPIIGEIVSEAASQTGELDSFVFLFNDCKGANTRSGVLLGKTAVLPNGDASPQLRLLQNDTCVAVGDVILVEPSGEATVLFEKNSRSNALMLTERCNCRCLMCPQPPKEDQEDLVGLALRLIPHIDPATKTLGLTGGEPTLAWEGLINVITECAQRLPDTFLNLLTNARVLKDYRKAEELAEAAKVNLLACVPLYADVDTHHDLMVSSKSAFWDTLEGLFNLARSGVPVELRTVVTKANYSRLPQWAEFVYRTFPFVVHIALMGMEPTGLAARHIDFLWIDPVDYAAELKEAVRILRQRNMHVSIYNHQLCILPQELWPFARKSISEWKNIYLPECEDCAARSDCGGFFHSAQTHKSRAITPFEHFDKTAKLDPANHIRKEC